MQHWPVKDCFKVDLFGGFSAFFFAATDCVSAFDTVLPGIIRQKGEILTQMSDFWFERTKRIVRNHRQGIGEADWHFPTIQSIEHRPLERDSG